MDARIHHAMQTPNTPSTVSNSPVRAETDQIWGRKVVNLAKDFAPAFIGGAAAYLISNRRLGVSLVLAGLGISVVRVFPKLMHNIEVLTVNDKGEIINNHRFSDDTIAPKGAVLIKMNTESPKACLLKDIDGCTARNPPPCFYFNLHDPNWFDEKHGCRNVKAFPVRLVEQKTVGDDQKLLVTIEADREKFVYKGGQYLTLFFDSLKDQCSNTEYPAQDIVTMRCYSILTPPEEFEITGKVQFIISPVEGGKGTAFFSHLGNKDALMLSLEPRGECFTLDRLKPHHKRVVYLGTGTGSAPLLSMLPELKKRGIAVSALLGYRKEGDAYCQEKIQQAQSDNQKLECRYQYSAPRTDGKKQYIQDRLSELNLDPESDAVFLCGNSNMVCDLTKRLKDIGFKTEDDISLFAEAFSFVGTEDAVKGYSLSSKPLIYTDEAKYE